MCWRPPSEAKDLGRAGPGGTVVVAACLPELECRHGGPTGSGQQVRPTPPPALPRDRLSSPGGWLEKEF